MYDTAAGSINVVRGQVSTDQQASRFASTSASTYREHETLNTYGCNFVFLVESRAEQ